MLSNTDFTFGPENCSEVDILSNLPSSNGYKHIITMMDVFSRYLFAYPTQDMTLRRQSWQNSDCNKSVVVLCGFFNCIITHAFQELRKVERTIFLDSCTDTVCNLRRIAKRKFLSFLSILENVWILHKAIISWRLLGHLLELLNFCGFFVSSEFTEIPLKKTCGFFHLYMNIFVEYVGLPEQSADA